MALDSYSNLKTAIINWSGRDDLSDVVDDFIDLAESKMFNNEDQPLRLTSFNVPAALQTTAGVNNVDLPTDYMGMRSMTITVSGVACELPYNSPSALPRRPGSGQPRAFTVINNDIQFDITPDAVYDLNLSYYARPVALSSAAPLNAVLDNTPEIYLYGALSELYKYTGEPQESEYWFGEFVRAIKGAVRADKKYRSPKAQARRRGSAP